MATPQYHDTRRRIRANSLIRELASSVRIWHGNFIQPLFVSEVISGRSPVGSLEGIFTDTAESVLQQIEADIRSGIRKFLLFPVPAKKAERDFDFTFATDTIRAIRERFGKDIWLASDLCLCAYTTHGHCGITDAGQKSIRNHESVQVLTDYALQLASAGADCIAPSDMMDGRIASIRAALNLHGFPDTSIMSYSSKFSSQFYGPFRDACHSSPSGSGGLKDRKTYQISPFNPGDALLSATRDSAEGADIIMVKPAVPYMDIISQLSRSQELPVAAYHVSGEYQSLELLAAQGLADRAALHTEIWTSLSRAGAGIIISYAARHAREWIEKIMY